MRTVACALFVGVVAVAGFMGVILGFNWLLESMLTWSIWAGIALCVAGLALLGLAAGWSLNEIPDEEV